MNTTANQRDIQSNKTATITGSGRGIGKDIAIQLTNHVRNLVVCSGTQHEINSVVKEIENINNQVNVLGSRCDDRISSQVNSLVQSAADKFGSETRDILVNNAGVTIDKKLLDTSEDEWDQTIDNQSKRCLSSYKSCSSSHDSKKLWSYIKCKFWYRQDRFQRFIILLCKQVWAFRSG